MSVVYFSVVIPSYNSAEFIEKTLLSVCQQSYQNFEIIVSDDGSVDNTIAIAKSVLQQYSVDYHIIENLHRGPGATRDAGIQKAKYEWIALLDSDDYWLPEKLQQVNHVIEQDSSVNFIFHNEIYFEDKRHWFVNYVERYDAALHPFLALIRNNFLSPTSAVLHKNLLIQAGNFDASLLSAQDYELWLRMSLLTDLKLFGLNQYLAYYRHRSVGNISSNITLRLKSLLIIYHRYKKQIKTLSPRTVLELMRFKGHIYSNAGLGYWRHQQYLSAIKYILLGQCYWIRIDWIRKLIK